MIIDLFSIIEKKYNQTKEFLFSNQLYNFTYEKNYLVKSNIQMKKAIFLIICGLCFVECKEKSAKHLVYERSKKHDSIIDKYVINGAKRFNYKFQMK
ncbi:DUF5659 domain-containing protein [Tenacibaculum maritimum]|uniref:DUF5659 domain-containing protein n=1 Tax=Tenacibaculum maritimum TaxID=107401 RepID=UPI001330D4FC|nr:DUF5659 domain-containing protein [Tenacibaculum maritimum]MCD9581347.1 hypothetical protein [Tenacibaculum maritimum]MCD9635700.1 hypothetical protein [Tenacibaculum maritimum]